MRLESGQVAVITGGGSGMGRELAVQLHARGLSLALCDINAAALQDVVKILDPARVITSTFDVADRAAVKEFAASVRSRFSRCDILFNNAGVVSTNTFEKASVEDLQWVMNVNVWGPVFMIKELLPLLKDDVGKTTCSYIVNTSSIEGIMSIPGNAGYVMSKFALRGLSETLIQECGILWKSRIRTAVVHPGFVDTPLLANCGSHVRGDTGLEVALGSKPATKEQILRGFRMVSCTSSKAAAEQIIDGIERNRTRIMVGSDSVALDWLIRLWPHLLYTWQKLGWTIVSLIFLVVKVVGRKTCVALLMFLLWGRLQQI